jgi:hypothetical protein
MFAPCHAKGLCLQEAGPAIFLNRQIEIIMGDDQWKLVDASVLRVGLTSGEDISKGHEISVNPFKISHFSIF